MNSKLSKPELLALAALLCFALLIRLGGLSLPFVYPDDWGHSMFLLFARNYSDYGWMDSSTVPYFGYVGEQPQTYSNHPWLVPLILSVWGFPFDYSEFSYRSLAIVFSLASVLAIFLLGRQIKNTELGVIAAITFCSAPLSIHVGRTYCLELVHVCFILWFLVFFCRWRAGESSWRSTALLLGFTQMSDLFGLFVSLWLFALGAWEWRQQRAWKGLFGLGCVPIFVQACIMGLLVTVGSQGKTWNQSVGRAENSWDFWFSPQYWSGSIVKIAWNHAYVLPLLSLLGLFWILKKRREGEKFPEVVIFWWYFPVLYTILGAYWFGRHNHLALFYGPGIALSGAIFLSRVPRWFSVPAIICHLAISGWLYSTIFHQPQRFHYQEVLYSMEIRKGLKRSDLVVGLPPHIAYYVRHRDVLPWNAFLKTKLTEEDVQDSLLPSLKNYKRVIIFPQFLEWPTGAKPVDFRKVLSGNSDFRLVSSADSNPIIWERVSPRTSRPSQGLPSPIPSGK